MFLKLKVLKSFSTDITTHLINEDDPNIESITFQVGEVIDVDVLDENDLTYTELQFGDGSMCFQLPKKLFKVIKKKD